MHIIQLNSYITLNGGSETVMANLTGLLEEHGHEVLNIGYKSVKEDKLMDNYFSLGPEKQQLSTFFTEKKTVDLIIEKILQNNTGLVICHNVYHKYPITELLKAIKERTKAKLVIIFHDYKAVCPRCNLFNGKRICTDCSDGKFFNVIRHRCRYNSLAQSTVLAIDSYYNNSIKDAYSYPDLFISPSHFLANQFGKMGFKYPIKVIHNPFNTAAFTRRKSHSKKQHAVLYAGRFSVDKGIALYLNLAKQFSEIKFLIAGAGDVEDDVRKADREMANVEYLGSLNREQLFNTFDKVDYLILPSIWYENNPNIIIEAMSFGLPVIGSNLGGIPELIGEGRGFLFDPLKPASLPDLMKSLDTLSPEAYQEVSEKSMAFAQTLSFENYYNQLSAIIPELKLDPVLQ